VTVADRPVRGRHRRRRPALRRTTIAAALAVTALVSGVAGVRLLDGLRFRQPSETGDVPAAAGTATPAPASTSSTSRAAAARSSPTVRPVPPAVPPVPPSVPTRLTLPEAKLTAPVVPVGTRPDGELRVPDSPRVLGWWVRSAPVGDPDESTVLAGHVDSARTGPGPLAALRDMKVGDRLMVLDAFGGHHDYRLAARREYPKYALPDDVFTVAGRGRLVLITCGGPFDERTGHYRDNVVGYAVPA